MNAARDAVTLIINDLTDRRGLRQAWEGIDPGVRQEIRTAWEEAIRKAWPDMVASSSLSPLPRYGLQHKGPILATLMDDGYWTPWHLAQAELDRRQATPMGVDEDLLNRISLAWAHTRGPELDEAALTRAIDRIIEHPVVLEGFKKRGHL